MQIQVNTDRNIGGDTSVVAEVSGNVESSLSRYSGQITRVEVHLSDENSNSKGGNDDMRCLLEARLEGRQPMAVTHRRDFGRGGRRRGGQAVPNAGQHPRAA